MTPSASHDPPALRDAIADAAPGTAMLLQQVETLLRMQERLLTSFEDCSRAWMSRRREDVLSGYRALADIRATADAATRSSLLQDWALGCLNRLHDDIDDFGKQTDRLSRTLEPPTLDLPVRRAKKAPRRLKH